MEDLISVIIPAYNHENYIQETVYSIISQTYQRLELIIIDDGSTDSTFNKILELKPICENRFERFVCMQHKNQGVAITNEKLKSLSKGKYLYMVASDDVAKPEAIITLYRFLIKNPEYLYAVGNNDFIDKNSRRVFLDEKKCIAGEESAIKFKSYLDFVQHTLNKTDNLLFETRNKSYLSKDDILYSDLWKMGHYLPIGGLVYKNAIDKIIPYNINCPMEDAYLILQLTKLGKVKVLDQVLLSYRIHDTNSYNQHSKMILKNTCTWSYEIYLLDKYYKSYLKATRYCCPFLNTVRYNYLITKNSKYWDEKYYINKYPEVVKNGFIPIVHYLSYGVNLGLVPSRYFETRKHLIKKDENPVVKKERIQKYLYLFQKGFDFFKNIFLLILLVVLFPKVKKRIKRVVLDRLRFLIG